MNLGPQIKKWRSRQGISQAALAKNLGIAQSTVGNWEAEIRNPSSTNLPELADALDCTIDELYGRGEAESAS